MDVISFFKSFEKIANAPGGVVELRRLVLSAAFSGNLGTQAASDESVDTLFNAVNLEIERQVASGEVKRPKPLPPITDRDASIDIPSTWRWVRFGQIAHHNSGKTLDTGRNSGHRTDYITTSNLYWGRFDLVNMRTMLIRDAELAACTARMNDLLICEGGEAGRAAVWPYDREVCFQNHIHRARLYAEINPHFIFRYLQKLSATGEINAHRKGIGISNMSGKALSMIPVPLPPLAEQARIVSKVDELMALCDQLEKQQVAQRALQIKTRKVLIQTVVNASASGEILAGWDKLTDRFANLFSSPEDVEDLRALVCGLAVQGLVAEHVTTGESASELIDRLKILKNELLSQGKLSRQKPVVPEVFKQSALPPHWLTISLAEVIAGIDAGWSPACLATPRRDEETWGVLKTTSVQRMNFSAIEHKELPSSLVPRPQYELFEGDILVTRAGPKNRVGICCVAKNVPPRLMISDKLIRFHIVGDMISSDFVAMCITYGETGRILERLKSGMADSQMNISQDKLRSLPVPVPPYSEQLSILKRIEGLMSICDQLEGQLKQKFALAERFAQAAVSNITGIAVTEEEAELKIPQTELIARLRIGTQPSGSSQAPLASILVRHSGALSAKDLWQRFGGEIDGFYAQLKHEVAMGWIVEPEVAEMRERETA